MDARRKRLEHQKGREGAKRQGGNGRAGRLEEEMEKKGKMEDSGRGSSFNRRVEMWSRVQPGQPMPSTRPAPCPRIRFLLIHSPTRPLTHASHMRSHQQLQDGGWMADALFRSRDAVLDSRLTPCAALWGPKKLSGLLWSIQSRDRDPTLAQP